MPAPQVVGRPSDVAPWVTTYYVPPAGEGPNLLAQFWAGFNASRTPDAEMLFRLRLQGMDPSAKQAEMAKLLKLDAELAEKAAESQRYSQEFQSKWDENQIAHEKNLVAEDVGRMDSQSRVAAAEVGLDIARQQNTRLSDKERDDLAAYNAAIGHVRQLVADSHGDPSAIADAATQLSIANEAYNKAAQDHISNPGEAGTIAANQATALDGLLRDLPQDTRAILTSGISTLPQLDAPQAPARGVRAGTLPPLDLRGNDGGFKVSEGRSGSAGVSGTVPSTGAGPGRSLPGSTPGGTGASTVPAAATFTGSPGYAPGGDAAMTAIQSARARLATQMDQVLADWGQNPYGNIGDPLITRPPRGLKLSGEARQPTTATATASSPLPPHSYAPAPDLGGAPPPTSVVIPSFAAHFDRSEGGSPGGGSAAPSPVEARRPSAARPTAPPPSANEDLPGIWESFQAAKAQRQAQGAGSDPELEEAAREMNALPTTPSQGPPPDQGPPRPPPADQAPHTWNLTLAPGAGDRLHPLSPPADPLQQWRASHGPASQPADTSFASSVANSIAGAVRNAAAPYTNPDLAWNRWGGGFPPPGTSPSNPGNPPDAADAAARARFTAMFQHQPDTGTPIDISEENDDGLAWNRGELDPAPKVGSASGLPFDATAAWRAYEAAHVNDEPTQQSIADAYAKRKRAATQPHSP